MQIVELYSWLSSHQQEAARLCSLIGSSDIQNVATALAPYNDYSCDKAIRRFLSEHSRLSAVDQMHITSSRKLLAQPILTLYHGNKDANMVPLPNAGKANCDFGKGFTRHRIRTWVVSGLTLPTLQVMWVICTPTHLTMLD